MIDATTDTPVLVVGGSLVGLSTAMLLGRHGVPTIVVEHHRGTAIHPRAAQVSQRTMEIFREVGIESIVRASSAGQFVQDGAIVAVESLAGRELATFIANLNDGVRDVSPAERVFISQSLLEPMLRARAEELGADLRFATEMLSFDQDDRGVRALVRHRDTGVSQSIRAEYLVAADGAHSRIREQLGIPLRGRGTFSHSVTIYFRADVVRLLRGRNLSVIYVNHPELRGFFRFEKPFDRGFLAIMALGDPARPQTDVATGLTESRCIELVRLALGWEGADVVIENVMPWQAEANVAERLRLGRVFLAGDSAHVMPPNGGFGGNTGIQDAHNLAWKLAAVLAGSADQALLETYEQERSPVGAFTTEQAYSRYVTRSAPYLSAGGFEPVAGDLDVELGYAYASAAVCPEGSHAVHGDPRQSKGRPGTRAPHCWLERNGERISTLDLFGRGFVMLAATHAGHWCEAARTVARARALPLEVHRLETEGLTDADGGTANAYGLSPQGAVIVRPDGFVGWRAPSSATDLDGCATVIADAFETMLCRRSFRQ